VKWLQENGVKAIRCCIHPNHLASQRVASNAGFSKSNATEDGEAVWML
jgi:RimJ/RimL family protein N-acetyltransferase